MFNKFSHVLFPNVTESVLFPDKDKVEGTSACSLLQKNVTARVLAAEKRPSDERCVRFAILEEIHGGCRLP